VGAAHGASSQRPSPGLLSPREWLNLTLDVLPHVEIDARHRSGASGNARGKQINIDPNLYASKEVNFTTLVHESVHVLISEMKIAPSPVNDLENELSAYFAEFVAKNGRAPTPIDLEETIFNLVVARSGPYAETSFRRALKEGGDAGKVVLERINELLSEPLKDPKDALNFKNLKLKVTPMKTPMWLEPEKLKGALKALRQG
jgi:hypothetical protein